MVCGGGPGVMEAVWPRARSAGGTTVGSLLGLDRRDGTRISVSPSPPAWARDATCSWSGRATPWSPSGADSGPSPEIALALRTGVPVIGLATWSLHLDSGPVDAFPVADDAETAAHLAIDAARSFQTDPTRGEPDV